MGMYPQGVRLVSDTWNTVHGERFGAIRPANTLVRADLIGDEYLVEIEAEALVGSSGGGLD